MDCYFLLQGIFPTQGSKLLPLVSFSSCIAGWFFTTEPPGKSPWKAQKFSVLVASSSSLCSLLFVPLVSYLRILSQMQGHELYPCFLLRVLQFFDPFWVNLCVWCKIAIQFYSACGCLVFFNSLIEETVLCLLYILDTFVNYLIYLISLCSHFCSIDVCICFYADTIVLISINL